MRALIIAVALSLGACAHRPQTAPEQASSAMQASSLYEQGLALSQQGDLTRAEQYLSAALRAGHPAQITLSALLETCVKAGRLRSALSYASPHLADHPEALELRLFVATLHFALRDHARAEHELRVLLEKRDDLAEAHYLLALVIQARGADRRDANQHFARYLQLAPQGRHADEARSSLSAPVQRVAHRNTRS